MSMMPNLERKYHVRAYYEDWYKGLLEKSFYSEEEADQFAKKLIGGTWSSISLWKSTDVHVKTYTGVSE